MGGPQFSPFIRSSQPRDWLLVSLGDRSQEVGNTILFIVSRSSRCIYSFDSRQGLQKRIRLGDAL